MELQDRDFFNQKKKREILISEEVGKYCALIPSSLDSSPGGGDGAMVQAPAKAVPEIKWHCVETEDQPSSGARR